jgi:hypothetical protein
MSYYDDYLESIKDIKGNKMSDRNEHGRRERRANTKKSSSGAIIDATCLCCGDEFTTSVVDRKTGKAKYCSANCKQKKHKNNL